MPKSVAFRVDASLEIGTGHVMRCLALAGALRDEGIRCIFICRQNAGNLIDLISREGYEVFQLSLSVVPNKFSNKATNGEGFGADWLSDALQTSRALEGELIDWLIVDHYSLDARWENELRQYCKRLMVIDDLANRQHDCDLLLDQNIVANMQARYDDYIPKVNAKLLGPSYALLHSSYASLHKQAHIRSGRPHRILVFFGGVDQGNLTHIIIDALLKLNRPNIEINVIVGEINPHRLKLEALVADHSNIQLHEAQTTLGPMMLESDLGIGAGGTTTWERLCLGLPCIVITIAENQRPIAKALHKRGLIRWIGDKANIEIDKLPDQLQDALSQSLEEWSSNCLKVVDGLGAKRVCSALLADRSTKLIARPLLISDESQLLEWANDPQTRLNSFSIQQITSESHHIWFTHRLNKTNCHIFIVETTANLAIGQVRFELTHKVWEIHFSITPVMRGRGMGTNFLRVALDAFNSVQPNVVVLGQVKSTNHASRHIFEALGFKLMSNEKENVATYQLNQF